VQAPIASWMADGHAALSKEATKAHMFTQLVELAKEHAGAERAQVDFLCYPHEVRAKSSIIKGALMLIPATSLDKIVFKSATSTALVKYAGAECYLEPPRRPANSDTDEWKKDIIMAAYWWVKTSSDQSSSNMKWARIDKNGVSIPVIENTKKLTAFDKLVVYQPESAAKKAKT
jgi:hypothetical protein